jgi:cobalt-zinc-cadmium efflux system protein
VRRYGYIFLLTLLIAGVEFVGNALSGSLALLADMTHVLLDSAAALISMFVAYRVRSHTEPGRFRARWMRVSGSILLLALAWITVQAIGRFAHPQPVVGWVAMLSAGLGMLLNLGQHELVPHDHTVTAQAQRLHVLGDLFTSAIVVAAGGLVWITGESWLDPLSSLCVVGIVGYFTIKMLMSGDGHAHHHHH